MRRKLLVWLLLLCLSILTAELLFPEKTLEQQIRLVEDRLLKAVAFSDRDRIGENIMERMYHYKVPGVSIAVIDNGQLVWSRGYGTMEVSRERKVTRNTLFQTGSVGKMIAALTVMGLVNRGVLDLDEDVNAYLTSWKLPVNAFNRRSKVTLGQLLGHRAGIGSDNSRYHHNEPLPTLTEHLMQKNYSLIKKPGESYFYSGAGYIIVEQVIEDVTKKKYRDIARELVLEPLGMSSTIFEIVLPEKMRKHVALAHRENGSLYKDIYPVYPCFAPGTCNWSTAEDLAKLFVELRKSYYGKSNRWLPGSLSRKMISNLSPMYGLGIKVIPDGEDTLIGHSGDFYGFHACLYGYLKSGKGIAVMTNGDNGVRLYNEIIRSVARHYQWPGCRQITAVNSVSPDVRLDRFSGCYFFLNRLDIVNVYAGEKMLTADLLGYQGTVLKPVRQNEFYHSDTDGFLKFHSNRNGKIDRVEFRRIGVFFQGSEMPGFDLLYTDRYQKGIEMLLAARAEYSGKFYFERIFNQLGYSLLAKKMNRNAIAVFQLGVTLYPEASNLYDSLGEAYMIDGQNKLAVKNYKKSLLLDPSNRNAEKMINKLEMDGI